MKQFFILLFCIFQFAAFGTHLRAGYISAKPVSAGSFTYQITLTIYVNSGSPVRFGNGQLSFGDGTFNLTPVTQSIQIPGQPNVGVVTYEIQHTYASFGTYRLTYTELNRDVDIVNLNNSVVIPFVIESLLVIDPFVGSFGSPWFLTEPFFFRPLGSPISCSFAMISDDDLLLTYELAEPKIGLQSAGDLYQFPENVSINPFNGLLTWDTKFHGNYVPGEYLFTIKVRMWKEIDAEPVFVGFITFDAQIILEDDGTSSEAPALSDNSGKDENGRLYLPPSEEKTIKILHRQTTPTATSTFEVFTELDNTAYSMTQYDSSTNAFIRVGILTLTSLPELERNNPYIISVRVKEEPKKLYEDLNFLFYTRDIQPQVITGTKESTKARVYPNPFEDKLNLDFNSFDFSGRGTLLDLQGKVIRKFSLVKFNSLRTDDLSPGVYIIQVEGTKGIQSFRIIKN